VVVGLVYVAIRYNRVSSWHVIILSVLHTVHLCDIQGGSERNILFKVVCEPIYFPKPLNWSAFYNAQDRILFMHEYYFGLYKKRNICLRETFESWRALFNKTEKME
jgi:hypothetical protein